LNVLFICSQNKWRSPTAEYIFAVGFNLNTRSAGTSKHAKHTVNLQDIRWADLIFVMEFKHKKSLQEKFRKELQSKKVIVLDIPDDYHYMDDELIELLRLSVTSYLK
jgi:predicted protein tyrosine phosphatase